jgi:hypothetical protein
MHCLYGNNVDTPGVLKFKPGGFPDKYPDVIPDKGDGTVNLRSLEAFKVWEGKQKQPIRHKMIDGAEHMAIMSNPATLQYLTDFLKGEAKHADDDHQVKVGEQKHIKSFS